MKISIENQKKRKISQNGNPAITVKKVKDITTEENFSNFNLLEKAIKNNDKDTYKETLKKSKNKNPKNTFGETALHIAAKFGSIDIFKMILDMVDNKNPKGLFTNYINRMIRLF